MSAPAVAEDYRRDRIERCKSSESIDYRVLRDRGVFLLGAEELLYLNELEAVLTEKSVPINEAAISNNEFMIALDLKESPLDAESREELESYVGGKLLVTDDRDKAGYISAIIPVLYAPRIYGAGIENGELPHENESMNAADLLGAILFLASRRKSLRMCVYYAGHGGCTVKGAKSVESGGYDRIMSYEDAKKITLSYDDAEIEKTIDLLLSCQNEFKTTSNPGFLFEVYLLKIMKALNGVQQATAQQPFAPQKQISQAPLFTSEPVKPIEKPAEPQQKVVIQQEKPVEEFKISSKSLDLSPIAVEGDSYEVDLQELLNLTIISNKQERASLIERWPQLANLINDPTDGPYAALLSQGKPLIVTNANLVLVYDLKVPATRANIKENQDGLAKIVKKLLGRKVCVYALNRDNYTNLLKNYRNLDEVGKLPNKKDIEDKKIF